MWAGSTARQRFEAFRRQPGIVAVASQVEAGPGSNSSLVARARWKLQWPPDSGENAQLLRHVADERPDVVFVDNSPVISRATLRQLRKLCDPVLVYYSPDDMTAPHNLSWPMRLSFREWDVIFTTKSFNIEELSERGVKNPVLVGNAFDAAVHRPMTCEEVGEDYERYDLVFIGTVEDERLRSIVKLADAGFTVAVYGNPMSRRGETWQGLRHPRILAGPAVYGAEYTRRMHHGRVALGFLRKMNRDLITTRSIEIPAMGRPMVAESTPEHDACFIAGLEYVGFRNDRELIQAVSNLIQDRDLRLSIASRGYRRCLSSPYSTDHRAQEMIDSILRVGSRGA
jgi:spore maturation protein CgeB